MLIDFPLTFLYFSIFRIIFRKQEPWYGSEYISLDTRLGRPQNGLQGATSLLICLFVCFVKTYYC